MPTRRYADPPLPASVVVPCHPSRDTERTLPASIPMTPEQIAVVKASWEQLRPVSEQTVFLFYTRLFEQHPELHDLFRTGTPEQGHKLMAMLDTAVASLDDLDALDANIRELGARHLGYGVADDHYVLFEDALHWALSQGLGDGYTPDLESAWRALFGRIAETMRVGGRDAAGGAG
jgi:hemoglobin-like flavoprotein